MGLKNNDTNYRVLAGAAIDENAAVYIDSNGYAQAAQSDIAAVLTRGIAGICPQAVAAGEPVPVIRNGKVDGLTVAGTPAAGKFIYLQDDGTWADTPEAAGGFVKPLMVIPAGSPMTAGNIEAFIIAPVAAPAAAATHVADANAAVVIRTDTVANSSADTQAELRTHAVKINAIIVALEAAGIMATS